MPIVANEQQNEIFVVKASPLPRLRAPRKPGVDRELVCIHSIWNDANVIALKVFVQKAGGALRNCRKSDARISVNPAFERGEQIVVNPTMNSPKKTGTGNRSVILVAREFLQSMEQ